MQSPQTPRSGADRRPAAAAPAGAPAESKTGSPVASDSGAGGEGTTDERGERTRRALLDAAERLFAEHGFAATSLRRITAAAGANLAAVHYHFGSKQELFDALFHRRVEPLNRARLDRLAELESDAGDGAPALVDLVDALMRPVIEVHREPGGEHFARLVARLLAEPNDRLEAVHGEFEQVRARFLPHIAAHVPHLSLPQLAARMQLTIGAMASVLGQLHRGDASMCGGMPTLAADGLVDELVAFATAGIAAPVLEPDTDAPSSRERP